MNVLSILSILLKAEIIDINIKVNLPPGFLTELDKATADGVIKGPELGKLIDKYQEGE